MSKLCGVQNLTKQLKSFNLNHTSIAQYAMTSGGTRHKHMNNVPNIIYELATWSPYPTLPYLTIRGRRFTT